MDYRHCRFCGEHVSDDELVKYGTRAYAHPVCLFERKGEDGIRSLPVWQIEQLPVLKLARVGLTFERLEAIIAEKRVASVERIAEWIHHHGNCAINTKAEGPCDCGLVEKATP